MSPESITLLIPLAGPSSFFDKENYPYPKPLIEIAGKPMIQLVWDGLQHLPNKIRPVFVIRREDVLRFHLDNTLRLVAGKDSQIVILENETMGAACTCLMAIDHFDPHSQLLIVNGDQIIEDALPSALKHFVEGRFDAGVVTFPSVHPKWSYVRTDDRENVVEAAEKNPISRNAIAGAYWFSQGDFFTESAFLSIRHGAAVNGLYFLAPVLNELILANRRVGHFGIQAAQYHSFYSPQKIRDFEQLKMADFRSGGNP